MRNTPDIGLKTTELFDDVEVLRWFARGRCLARDTASGTSFLIEGAVPGERVQAKLVTSEHRRVAYVTDVLAAAASRATPRCRYANTCSGCELLHVSPAEESRYKALVCAEVLGRFAGIDVAAEQIEVLGSSERGGHRVRARFAIGRSADGAITVGLRDRDGEANHIPDCVAATPRVRETLLRACSLLEEGDFGSLEDGAAIEVIEGVQGVAVITHGFAPCSELQAAAWQVALGAVALGQSVRKHGVELRAGAWPAQLPVAGVALEAAVDAWVQPSPTRAEALYRWVETHACHADLRVLDATCGTGGLSLLLARRAASVQGIDANIEAVRSAQRSAEALGVQNAVFRGGLFETVGPRMVRAGERFEIAVVNPMRRTLGAVAMAAIDELGVQRVIYLGPAPRAAADDVAELVRRGFVVERVAAANLHPGTAQVMLCVLLVRTPASAGATTSD